MMAFQISLVQQFEQQQHETWELAFSPNGNQLISSDGSAFYRWHLTSNGLWTFDRSFPWDKTTFPRFTPKGELLRIAYGEESVNLTTIDGKGLDVFPRPPLGELGVWPYPPYSGWASSSDFRWFLCNSQNHTLLLWDRASAQHFCFPYPYPLDAAPGAYSDSISQQRNARFFFSPTGRQVLFWEGASVHLCQFDSNHPSITLQKSIPHGRIDSQFSPDGKWLAIIDSNRKVYEYRQDIYLFSTESYQLCHVFPQPDGPEMLYYCLLAFSPDCHHLISCRSNGEVDIFSLETLTCVAQFDPHPGLSSHATDPLGGLAWSSTGYLATGGASVFEKNMKKTDYSIKLWKIEEEASSGEFLV